MGNLTISKAVKYGAMVGVGLAVAKPVKNFVSVTILYGCKKLFPDIYEECKNEAIEKRKAKES